jgi:hypothetical protein
MSQSANGRRGAVIGPAGRPLTMEDLPPPETKRWVSRRKAEVVVAVRYGLLSLEDACRRYNLSVEEFLSWQRLVEKHGVQGLRATRLQDYRGADGFDGALIPETDDDEADDDLGYSSARGTGYAALGLRGGGSA